MKRILAAVAGTAAVLSLSACADKVDEAESTNFTVTASDESCEVSGTEATTGTSTFDVTNTGKKTTEFYVYTSGGRVVVRSRTSARVLPASWLCRSPIRASTP